MVQNFKIRLLLASAVPVLKNKTKQNLEVIYRPKAWYVNQGLRVDST